MEWTIALLPDTQVYAKHRPDLFVAQVAWIAREHERLGIRLVLHEGDVVDDASELQWSRAAAAMRALDGRVPYLVTTGNHDLGPRGCASDRSTRLGETFPLEALGVRGTFEPGHPENAWTIAGPDASPWLALALELAPRAAVVAWAREILDAHAALPAIVVTHAFLYHDGTRYDRARTDQRWRPDAYGVGRMDGAHDGEALYRALIEPCDNVRLVVSGHVLSDAGTARRSDVRPTGAPVHQLLTNFQTWPNGGDGWLRLLTIDGLAQRVRVRTYSPIRDRSLDDALHSFDLDAPRPRT